MITPSIARQSAASSVAGCRDPMPPPSRSSRSVGGAAAITGSVLDRYVRGTVFEPADVVATDTS